MAWIPVASEALLLLALAYRHYHPAFLEGQLLPSLVLALAPGCALRLLGRPSLPAHRVGMAVGLITFMFTNGTFAFAALKITLRRWEFVLPAIALVLLQPLLGTWRWRLLLAAQDIQLSFRECLRLVLVGCFFNAFVPGATGGDIFRAYYVARGRQKTEAAITTVVLDRLVGLPPLVLIAGATVLADWKFFTRTPAFQPYAWAAGGVALLLLVVFGILCLGASRSSAQLVRWSHLPGGVTLARFCRAVAMYRTRKQTLVAAFVISLLAHFFTIGAGVLAGAAAGMEEVPASRYPLLVPMGLVINAVPITPGGLGQGEWACAQVFEAAAPGLGNKARGAALMLCLRIGLLISGLAGGILYALGRHAVDDAWRRSREEPDLLLESAAGGGPP